MTPRRCRHASPPARPPLSSRQAAPQVYHSPPCAQPRRRSGHVTTFASFLESAGRKALRAVTSPGFPREARAGGAGDVAPAISELRGGDK
ncbi:hypothetical protein NN561_017876 [Cricetulus griseus]